MIQILLHGQADGSLLDTGLSGWVYQVYGLVSCLCWSAVFVLLAALLSFGLPDKHRTGNEAQ